MTIAAVALACGFANQPHLAGRVPQTGAATAVTSSGAGKRTGLDCATCQRSPTSRPHPRHCASWSISANLSEALMATLGQSTNSTRSRARLRQTRGPRVPMIYALRSISMGVPCAGMVMRRTRISARYATPLANCDVACDRHQSAGESLLKGPNHQPMRWGKIGGKNKKAPRKALVCLIPGGEGGIRTLGRVTPTPDFESGTFDHSATSPQRRSPQF